MDWLIIEYDDKDSDSHVFMSKITDEFRALMNAADDPDGCGLYCNRDLSSDNVSPFYVNPEGARIHGVRDLLSSYGAKECSKPTEPCALLAGNNAEILHGEKSGE